MSSKRGRKRNDNLPPNRARDVQRAFRARRAAHLLALEERVNDLELENARLRKMVGWPPDDRPALGKGPTGKDKPKLKGLDANSMNAVDFFTTRGSSSPGEDSSSNRTGSLSPTTPAPGRHMPVIDDEAWANALTMDPEPEFGTVEPVYQPAPLSAPIAQKPFYQQPYDHSGTFHSTSLPAHRHSVHTSAPYTQQPPSSATADNYSHSQSQVSSNDRYSDRPLLDRHVSSSFTPPFATRGDLRDEPRQSYTYSPTAFSTPDPNMPSSESPPLASISPAQQQAQGHPRQGNPITTNSSTYLPHRRSFPESYTLGQAVTHLPASHHSALRIPEYPRAHDVTSQQPYRVAYGPDGRVGTLP